MTAQTEPQAVPETGEDKVARWIAKAVYPSNAEGREELVVVIATAIRAAVEAEREACAVLVEAGLYHWLHKGETVAAIRARGEAS